MKKLLSLALTVVFLFPLFSSNAVALEGPIPWDGSIATCFSSGSGTSEDPYLIETASEAALLFQKPEPAHYSLVKDIDFGSKRIRPCGLCESGFEGTLNGNGHCISNGIYTVDPFEEKEDGESYDSNISLSSVIEAPFVCIGKKGLVKNLIIYQDRSSSLKMAGIVGINFGTMDGCTFIGKLYGKGESSGIALYNLGFIYSCINEGDIHPQGNESGASGIASVNMNHGKIVNCCNYGNIQGNSLPSGGIVGFNQIGAIVENCWNRGDINSNEKQPIIGLIAGINEKEAVIRYCSSIPSQRGKPLIGENHGIIDEVSIFNEKELSKESSFSLSITGMGIVFCKKPLINFCPFSPQFIHSFTSSILR